MKNSNSSNLTAIWIFLWLSEARSVVIKLKGYHFFSFKVLELNFYVISGFVLEKELKTIL